MHLVSYIKKIHIWYRKFRYTSNVRIIKASKLLNKIGDFSKNYDSAKIYNDSEAFKPEKSPNNSNCNNNDFASTDTAIETIIKVSKITNSNFDKIYESCMGSKQIWVMRQYKSMTSVEEKLEEVNINL